MDYKDLKSTLIKQASHLFSSQVIIIALSFVINITLVGTLGAKKNGMVVLTITTASLISLFIDLRFGETLIKFVGDFLQENKKSNALGMILIGYMIDLFLGILCFLILVLGREIIANFYHVPELKKMLLVYAFMLLISTVNITSMNIFHCFREFSWVSVQIVLQKVLDAFFVILAIIFYKSVMSVMYAYLFSSIIFTIIASLKAMYKLKKSFCGVKPVYGGINFREIIRFTFHTTYASTLKSMNRYMDIVLLGFFCDPRMVTYYKNGVSLGGLLGVVSDPIYKVIYPVMVMLKKNNDFVTMKKIIKKIILIGIFVGVPVGLGICMLAPYLIKFIYKGISDPSVDVLRIVVWAHVINLMSIWQRPVYLAFGRSEIGSKVATFAFCCFILLLVILVPKFQYVGAAISYLSVYVIIIGIVSFYTMNLLKKHS